MGKEVQVARAEYETAAQLKWVLTEFVLMMTSFPGALSGRGVVLAQKVKKIC